jgi:hypothetical protein
MNGTLNGTDSVLEGISYARQMGNFFKYLKKL